MSAAEPANPAANPALEYVNATGGGHVIDISKRRPRGGALHAAQGRWTMATPPELPHGRPDPTPLALFADDIETSFNTMEPPRTLTDDDTVAVYLKSLDIWQRVLEGSCASGIITEEQLAELAEVLKGMRQAPGLV